MTAHISIPKPCNENWDNFTPAEQGRHCQTCAKTVIDFTNWEPNAISTYLLGKKEGETCGRFYNTQLTKEETPTADDFTRKIAYFKISTLKKIAAIFLFAFFVDNAAIAQSGMLMGEPAAIPPPATLTNKKQPKKQTDVKQTNTNCSTTQSIKMGKVALTRPAIKDTTKAKPKKINPPALHENSTTMGAPIVMGDVAYDPTPNKNVKPTVAQKASKKQVAKAIKR
jgi:hypothetical protein